MEQYLNYYNLNEEQATAVQRFCNYHHPCMLQSDGSYRTDRPLEWRMDHDDGSLELVCCCGATLHLTGTIYVTVESQSLKRTDKTCAKRMVEETVDQYAPEDANIDLGDERPEPMKRSRKNMLGIAEESLFQSALVSLPDETFKQIRLNPSTTEMHFGLGLYLRNRFVHSGLLWSGVDPDAQSSGATFKLIKYCIPEFRDYDLIYEELGSGALYAAYRYCMEVLGEFPKEEFTKHYEVLLDAQQIRDSNPYSIADVEHSKEWGDWSEKALEKRRQYTLATLHEIWNFGAIREDLGDKVAKQCEETCLAALCGKRSGFMPSEIAYAMAGLTDDRAMNALAWATNDVNVVDHFPDQLFTNRKLVLEMVSISGGQLERAKLFQDDDEVVLAAVANSPMAIRFASDRLQNDRRVLVEAASHADSDLVFFDGPLAKYSDDDELAGLAIDANGANIEYASERIRNDFNWAMRAVTHQGEIYPGTSYEALNSELKKDKRIALAVAQWETPPNEFPAKSLADDDEIGEVLSHTGNHFDLIGMSRRIKKKYMTDEELERWGDDPWWWHDEEE